MDDIEMKDLLNKKQLKFINNYEIGQLSFNQSFIDSISFVQSIL